MERRRVTFKLNPNAREYGTASDYYSQQCVLIEIEAVRPEFAALISHALGKLNLALQAFFRRLTGGHASDFRRMCAGLLLLFSGVAFADCFGDAASFHHVNPIVLRAIAIVESGGRPNAKNTNRNGSVDYGLMQINSIHLPELARYGIGVSDLYDGCKSVYTGALILLRSIDRYGNTWAAVGTYNSATPYFRDRYAAKVKSVVNYLLTHGYADEAQ